MKLLFALRRKESVAVVWTPDLNDDHHLEVFPGVSHQEETGEIPLSWECFRNPKELKRGTGERNVRL